MVLNYGGYLKSGNKKNRNIQLTIENSNKENNDKYV